MLVDIYRGIRIVVKFLFYDVWVGAVNILFRKQNDKIKTTYQRRVQTKKKRLWKQPFNIQDYLEKVSYSFLVINRISSLVR